MNVQTEIGAKNANFKVTDPGAKRTRKRLKRTPLTQTLRNAFSSWTNLEIQRSVQFLYISI